MELLMYRLYLYDEFSVAIKCDISGTAIGRDHGDEIENPSKTSVIVKCYFVALHQPIYIVDLTGELKSHQSGSTSGKVKHELRAASCELRYTSYEFKSTSYDVKSTS